MEEALRRHLTDLGSVEIRILPDERDDIEWELKRLADGDLADLVVTTGGTGLSERDVTPQATLAVVDYEIPGLAEAMRAATRGAVPTAILSRQVAGVRARTVILNLPGSPRGAIECLEVIVRVLPHAVATLRGEVHSHPVSGEKIV